ncbi:MAG TPA: TonB-dependent receptor [Longimicrobiaceae bacterium]|nr:TonB-dependent receptor [Longimicrobiaceae bacterium]
MRALLCGLAFVPLQVGLAAAQQKQVSGRVTSSVGNEPLSGVQVVVSGHPNVGTQTDQTGHYTLTVPAGSDSLSFSMIGYATEVAPIAGSSVVDMIMTPQAQQLTGLVVIGYGAKKKANLTESVGVVNTQEIQKVTVATPEAAIQGRVSGARVTTESGIPGAPVSIRIRGVGTVGNTQPLYVIDGVPVGQGIAGTASPLSTISPSDIESISVLKDASAAAVYGNQAANGVVLITTKRGKYGRPTIHYDGYYGVQQFPKYIDMANAQQWLAIQQDEVANYNSYFGYQPGSPDYRVLNPDLQEGSPVLASLLARNTDWTHIGIHDNAPITNHTISVSGASDQVNYYVSGAFFQQDAITQKWNLQRYNFRANSDFNITDRFRVGETFTISNNVTLRGSQNYGDGTLLNNLLGQPPIFVAYDTSLVSPTNPQGLSGNFQTAGIAIPNLNSTNQLQDVTDRLTRVLGDIHGEFDILPGLTIRSQNSLDYNTADTYNWQGNFTLPATGYARSPIAEDARGDAYTVVSTNTLKYGTSFGNSTLDLLAGMEANMSRNNSLSLQATDFVNDLYTLRRIPALGNTVLKRGGGAGEQNRLGYIGRASYNYADRYLLTGSIRRDGVSTFAPGHQWGTFPAFSAGWRISNEKFFHVPWIDELMIRGSWGQLGNSNIIGGDYPQYIGVNLWADYEIGGAVQLAPTPREVLANSSLTWETDQTTDFGFTSQLFHNSTNFSATYYQRDTKNFLVNVPVANVVGFKSAPINVGHVRNSGFEFEGGYNTRIAHAVDFGVDANLTTVKNELVSLTKDVYEYTQNGAYRTAVGEPIGYFYGYKTCGVYQSDPGDAAPTDKVSNHQPGAGDMCFVDLQGAPVTDSLGVHQTPPDGQITSDDRTYLGKTIPDFYYGVNFTAGLKNWDFTAFFSGVQGVQAYNQLRQNLESMSGAGNTTAAAAENRWTPTNPSNTVPRAISGDPAGNNRFSDRWIEDASYLRLKTLQIGYTLPASLLNGRLGNTRIYVSGTNLWTLTNYKGIDPEFTTAGSSYGTVLSGGYGSQNGSQLGARTDTGNVPQPRMFQVGLSTTF